MPSTPGTGPDFTDTTLTSEDGKSSFTPPNLPTAIRAAMWLRLGPLTPRSRDSPRVVVLCVAVVAATGAVLTAWRTARRA
jgi:hypothetical protein